MKDKGSGEDVLSELANRMARVSAVGAPSDTSAATFQTQDRSEPMLGWRRISEVTVVVVVHTQKGRQAAGGNGNQYHRITENQPNPLFNRKSKIIRSGDPAQTGA